MLLNKNLYSKNYSFMLIIACLMFSETSMGQYFPPAGGSWRTATPESQGMSTAKLQNAVNLVKNWEDNVCNSIGDIIVIRNGYDVYHYGNPYGAKAGWASCTRSICTAAFGQLIKERIITGDTDSVENPVNYISSSEAAKYDSSIKLKHLLSYTSCSRPPGTTWHYSCNYDSMHKIINDLDGQWPDYRYRYILAPAIGADWSFSYFHYNGVDLVILNANAAEAARWGYLWLNKGNWNGTQVVDEWYVERTLEPMPKPDSGYANPHEGWQIHLNYSGAWGDLPLDCYTALGTGWDANGDGTSGWGSMIFVCPSENLIIAREGNSGDEIAYYDDYVDGYVTPKIEGFLEPFLDAITEDAVPPSKPNGLRIEPIRQTSRFLKVPRRLPKVH